MHCLKEVEVRTVIIVSRDNAVGIATALTAEGESR
jgi:hypothetical protein